MIYFFVGAVVVVFVGAFVALGGYWNPIAGRWEWWID